ncbi:MAG: electron transport complex subunit RsxE [Bacilli bacterium]|nr:electron transport complex subunit RsxE [Bacilli bacterium]
MTKRENFFKGFWKENQILVSLLGLCAPLAITTAVENALGMSLALMFVLVMANVIVSAIRKIVPNEIRIPIFIVIIATLVTLVEMLMAAYLPALSKSLGIWIPLIVVNCIILGRAEAYASKNNVLDSLIDAVGIVIGYSFVIIVMSMIREFLGTGGLTIWGNLGFNINEIFNRPEGNEFKFFTNFFMTPTSAFIVLGFLIAFANIINNRKNNKKAVTK